MKINDSLLENSKVLFNTLNNKKFNKLICIFNVKNDYQNVIHYCEPNIIKDIYYQKDNDKCGKIFFRGNISKDVIKINYIVNDMLLDTVYISLSSECHIWYQYAYGNIFKIEIYE